MRLRWVAIFLGLALMAWAAAAASYAHADSEPATTSYTLATHHFSPSTRQVRITYGVGGCVSDDHVEVERSADAIVITLHTSLAVSSDGYALPCVPPTPKTTTVDLGGRLGHRLIYDDTRHGYIVSQYAYLRDFGHRITFDKPIPLDPDALGSVQVASFRVRHGTVLAHIANQLVPLGSPAGAILGPTDAIPDFTGKRLTAAIKWAQDHRLHWTSGTPARLVRATANTLLGNYIVTAQTPRLAARSKPARTHRSR